MAADPASKDTGAVELARQFSIDGMMMAAGSRIAGLFCVLGCGGLMKRARQFRSKGKVTRAQQKQQADKWRGSAHKRGYNSRWARARRTFLQANPLCIGCLAMGRAEAATLVDHVDPHHGDPEKFWNTDMWQACCKWHHDSVKQSLEASYARGKVRLADLHLDSAVAVARSRGLICE